jgi:hypothetical protein
MMPRRNQNTGKNAETQAHQGDAAAMDQGQAADFERQAREVSREVPDQTGDRGGALGADNVRSFAETDREERPDTDRRVGEIPRADGTGMDQGEFDEDGGGPRQSIPPQEGGASPVDNEMPPRDLSLQAETGGNSSLDLPTGSAADNQVAPGANQTRTEGEGEGEKPRTARKSGRAMNKTRTASGQGGKGSTPKKGRAHAAQGGGAGAKRGASSAAKRAAGRKGGKASHGGK